MNPFYIADVYLKVGYNVVMIDLQGVQDKGLAVEHVVGCEVLGGNCSIIPGWLDGLHDESFEKFSKEDDLLNRPLSELTVNDVQDLESLFRLRDCYYQRNVTNHPKFKILHETSIVGPSSSVCPDMNHDARHVPEELANTDILFNAIQSQKRCNRIPISLSTMLGHAPHVTLANVTQYPGYGNNTEESVDPTTTTTTTTTAVDLSRHAWAIAAVVGIVGMTILLWLVRTDRKGRYMQAAKMDGIMPYVVENPNRPLSEII